jgi:ABC transporter substrate binding protein
MPDKLPIGAGKTRDLGVGNNRRAQLVNLTARYTLPAIFSNRDFAEIGGLMSYGSDFNDAYRQVGVYVGRILKGAKPAELPVVQNDPYRLHRHRRPGQAWFCR